MISEAGATLRVARLEVLLERVRVNAGRPRVAQSIARAVSAASVSVRSDEPEIDYDDFADAEIVEIDVDEPSMAPAVQPRTSASPTAYSMSFVDEGLPDGIAPLTEGGEALIAGVVSTNPPAVLGDEYTGHVDDSGLALHSPQYSEPPTWQADAAQPTMEQLGNTIGLDGGDTGLQGPALELDVQSVPPPEAHDLEVSLPTRGFAGGYDEGLASPDTAQHDLEQYNQGSSFDSGAFDGAFSAGAPEAAASTDSAVSTPLEPMSAATAGSQAAHAVKRSELNPSTPVVEILDNRKAGVATFAALLDESMSLIDR